MIVLQDILAFFVVLGVLIVVHELGHYWVARRCGVKVLRFSVGMGKVVYSRRIGPDQTEWALSALPFGGYVKMLDAREEDLSNLPEDDLKREFTRQSVWRRIAIVAAGPIANFLLAIAVYAGLYMHGIPEPSTRLRAIPEHTAAYQAGLRGGETITAINGDPVQAWSDLRWKLVQLAVDKQSAVLSYTTKGGAPGSTELSLNGLSLKDMEGDFLGKVGLDVARPKAKLKGIIAGGPAEKAGLRDGDEILVINGKPVLDGLAFIETIQSSPNKPLLLHGLRGSQEFDIAVTPIADTVEGKTIGRIKVKPEALVVPTDIVTVSNSLPTAVAKGLRRTWETSVFTLNMLGKMIVGKISWRNISGTVAIADYAGQTARMGFISFVSYIALVSISLGVMNLLPIPVLDGGHLLYYSLEVLTGRPLPERVSELAQRAGLGLLMTLMVLALFNDVARRVPDFAAFFS